MEEAGRAALQPTAHLAVRSSPHPCYPWFMLAKRSYIGETLMWRGWLIVAFLVLIPIALLDAEAPPSVEQAPLRLLPYT